MSPSPPLFAHLRFWSARGTDVTTTSGSPRWEEGGRVVLSWHSPGCRARVDLEPRHQPFHLAVWDDVAVGCRRDGASFGDAAVVSRDSRRSTIRALSAPSRRHERSIGPLNGLSLLIDTGTIPSMVDVRIARKLHLKTEPSVLIAFGQQWRFRAQS